MVTRTLGAVLLLTAVTMATEWIPHPWNGTAVLGIGLLLGIIRPYWRRLTDRARFVRAAVAWLCAEPPPRQHAPARTRRGLR